MNKARPRPEKNTPILVDDYIAERPPAVAALLKDLKKFVERTLPATCTAMKWGAPVFFNAQNHPVIYLYAGRDHANIGFVRGAELDDPDDALAGRGSSGRHAKAFPGEPIPRGALEALIKQCAEQ